MRKKRQPNDVTDFHQEFIQLLFIDYRKLVLKKLHQRLNDISTIEDLSQDVFIRLIKNVEVLMTLEKPALVNYICQTTDSIVIDWARSNKAPNRVLSLDEMADCIDTEPACFETSVIERLDAERVLVLMEQLAEIDQQLLVGYYFMEYSVKELAELHHCSESKVMTRMFRARKRLLHLYNMRGDESDGR